MKYVLRTGEFFKGRVIRFADKRIVKSDRYALKLSIEMWDIIGEHLKDDPDALIWDIKSSLPDKFIELHHICSCCSYVMDTYSELFHEGCMKCPLISLWPPSDDDMEMRNFAFCESRGPYYEIFTEHLGSQDVEYAFMIRDEAQRLYDDLLALQEMNQ